MNRLVTILSMLMVSLALAAVSGSLYQHMGSDPVLVEGTGPGFDTVRVVVGGWPLPYLEDRAVVSPVGSVGFMTGITGEDRFRAGAFLADTAFFLAAFVAAWGIIGLLRRQEKRR